MPVIPQLVEIVRACLTDDLRKQPWRGNPNPVAGHCYAASEAIWHMLGGMESRWRPANIHHEGASHWYLVHLDTGEILDPTADQFQTPVPYSKGRRCGFLTRDPSYRAAVLISRAYQRNL